MARILVLYATHFGQTRAIAERIATRLRSHGDTVELGDVRYGPPPPHGFDAVVIGSRIELGRHAPEVRRYLIEHRQELDRLPTAFFSVSMAAARGDSADPNGYMATLFEAVAWQPTKARAFAGALPYRKYGWFLRMIMKRISRSAGHTTDTSRDHSFTSWARVDTFADELAGLTSARRATGGLA